MRVLFTGGSSFTGYWFIKELVTAGHDVVAVFRKSRHEYLDPLRAKRIDGVAAIGHAVFNVAFGDDAFLSLIKGDQWDLLCHHGAEVSNYKSADFDVCAAVQSNTHRLPTVLDALISTGSRKILLTGSVFENDEGTGSGDLRAFSPYALSKSFTWQLFRYHAEVRKMALGKFVIANPFGPFEEQRFTNYLIKTWLAGRAAAVNTPDYVRDNIHVSLLARIYARRSAEIFDGIWRSNPSQYVESQGAFTQRVANEMRRRLDLPCQFELRTQTDFSEPEVRTNTDPVDGSHFDWNEGVAWDELAAYYR